ncbi:MAG: IPT/TIG domain-containing protein [Terracidiphilus sp.]
MAASNLANLPSPPPMGSIQFFDGYFPALDAKSYTITLTHTLSGNASAPAPFTTQQVVTVQAPEFTINTGIVAGFYPPNGASDIYAEKLPFIILTDPALPWERGLFPTQGESNPANPTAWMALLILAESEVILPEGSNNPVTTTTVGALLTADPNKIVLKPQLPPDWVATDVLASQCQTITIPGAVFNAVVPSTTDLPFLTHCRGINTLDEGEQLLSILLANRLPQAAATPVRYFAQLVSLEGFGDYMGPNATPIPTQPGSQELMDVQMVSLYNWSFSSLPESGESFLQLMNGLVQSQQASTTQQSTVALQLPLPPATTAPQNVQDRLSEGFVPLQFITGSGEDSFAWYRGPFTAQPPQSLPTVGNPATPVRQATSADELMIYLAEQGLFDLSYAAAWNLGRNLALADAVFARNVTIYRNAVATSFATLTQRAAMSHFAAGTSAKALLAGNATRRRFTSLMAQGLGHTWTNTLKTTRQQGRVHSNATGINSRPQRRFAAKPTASPKLVVASPEAVAAVSTSLSEIIESVTAWLARLSLLYPVPFSHLVPDPRMLPVESIRFFYLDPGWTDALVSGALSIAMHSSADVEQQMALMPALRTSIDQHRARSFRRTRPDAALNTANPFGNVAGVADANGNGIAITGVLIRSAVVSGWPNLIVAGTLGGAPLNVIRDDCPSSTVRLTLFDGIPDTVTLAEPYQGILFGVENQGVFPRCVTAPAFTGSQIANGQPVPPTFRTPPAGSLGGVLQVESLASALQPAVGVTQFASDSQVNWNGTPLTTTFISANQLQATVPANLVAAAGSAAITVTSNGVTSQSQNFIVNAPLEIDTINPILVNVGVNGFTLTVDGVGFISGAVVQWNGTALTTTPISVNQITAQVPANLATTPASAAITVLAGTTTSNAVSLSVVSADPVLNSIQPNQAMAGGTGFTLTANGSGFATGAIVQWNGATLTTAFVNDQQLKATVPASLIAQWGTVQVTVAVNGATSNAQPCTITNAVPTIGSLYPSVALAGAGEFTLTIDGVSFGDSPTVYWGGSSLTPATIRADQITVLVPANLVTTAASVNVYVQSGDIISNSLPFLVTGPQPAVDLLDPPEVIAGGPQFTLNVYGGFGAGDFALQMVAAPELQSFPTT